MRRARVVVLFAIWTVSTVSAMEGHSAEGSLTSNTTDPLAWLEERGGERALEWVRDHNERTVRWFTGDSRYQRYYKMALADRRDRRVELGSIASPIQRIGAWVYHTWYDELRPYGVWRRTSLESLRAGRAEWHPVLDMESLAGPEKKPWTIVRAICSENTSRCLLALTRKWWKHLEFREFDISKQEFPEDGFILHESRHSSAVWRDDESLWVATDLGVGTGGDGRPLIVKAWLRGQPLSEAQEIFRVSPEEHDHVTLIEISDEIGSRHTFIVAHANRTRGAASYWMLNRDGATQLLTLPQKVTLRALFRGNLIVTINEDWDVAGKYWKAGSILAIPIARAAVPVPEVTLVATPGEREVLSDVIATNTGLLVFGMRNLSARVEKFTEDDDGWRASAVPMPENGTIFPQYLMTNQQGDRVYATYESFTQAPVTYEIDVVSNQVTPFGRASARQRTGAYITEQLEAVSKDGTRVPYFVVRPRVFEFNGRAPTILAGYGWDGARQRPRYDSIIETLWLNQGGVYVLALVRGGGELGPTWHVRREQRQHTYEDFKAVAEDLIKRKLTSPRRLGVFGYSAGGLLAGVALTQHPELFNAAFLMCPYLDNFRPDLVAGSIEQVASEYGSLDVPSERSFLARTSPYQNVRKVKEFPVPFIYSNTSDMNVFPAQPRRFAAKLESLGVPFFYYEAAEGGHSYGKTPEEVAHGVALTYVYFADRLMDSSDTDEKSQH